MEKNKYKIRVRAEYVAYYDVEATSLDEAEDMAKQKLMNEMNDQVNGSFDLEEFTDEEFIAEQKLEKWSEDVFKMRNKGASDD